MLEFRLDLGLGQGQNTRLSILVLGQPPNRQHPHSSSGKLLRIFPSLCSISHLVLHPPTTRKDSSPLCPDRTRYAPCRARGARQEPRGQLHCLDGFLAKERGNPMDRGAWWARSEGSQRVGQDSAGEHEHQAVPPLRRIQSTPECPPKQPAGGQRAEGSRRRGGRRMKA